MRILDADRIARRLLDDRGCSSYAIVWEPNWYVRAGRCEPKTKTIRISIPIVEHNDERILAEIVCHEAAHGVTPGEGHSSLWQAVAVGFGCSGVVEPLIPLPPSPPEAVARAARSRTKKGLDRNAVLS